MTTPHSADALKQTELLPCPMCAGKADVLRFGNREGGAAYAVTCSGCTISTAWAHAETEDAAKERAIAAWNRRPTPASDLCADLNAERINLNAGAKESTFIDIGALRGKLASMDENGFGSIRFTLGEARALLDRVERAEALVAALRKSLAHARSQWHEWSARADRLVAERAEAADAGSLLAALKPFADAYAPYAKRDDPNEEPQMRAFLDRNAVTPCMTVGDFRRAYAAFNGRAEAAAGAVPEGYVLVPIHATNAITCAIERQIDSQLTASGMDANAMFRQDGGYVWDAAIAAAIAAPPAQGLPVAPSDPMDWPLPCDVTVGCGTISKGVPLRTLVLRMKNMNDMIREGWASARAPAAAPSEPVAWKVGLELYLTREQAEANVRNPDLAPRPLVYGDLATPPAQDAGMGDAKEVAEEVAREVIGHIDTMYPAMWSAVAKTARTSIRNTVINQSVRYIRAIKEDPHGT